MGDSYYTSDQLVLCFTKIGYELHGNPRRGRWFFKHKTRHTLKPIIVPIGRNDLSMEYVKILLKDTSITFTEFKNMI